MNASRSDPLDLYDIDSAIESWQAAGHRLTVGRGASGKRRREAVAAFRCMNAALGSERGFPAELEDFRHEPRGADPGGVPDYAIELYGVPLGHVVLEARGPIFYPNAPVAERTNERVVVGAHSPASATAPMLREPQWIGEALNDAATLCLARLLQCACS